MLEENWDIHQYKFFKKLTQLPFIEEIELYGSRARGDNTSRSDIDLAIICPKASDSDWIKVFEIIEDADTLLKIDYVRFDQLDDANPLKKNIIRDRVVLYKRDRSN